MHTIDQKRTEWANGKSVVFLEDRDRPHILFTTRQKLRTFSWKILSHPPYSLDIARSEYYVFQSMANAFSGVKLASKEACEKRLSKFFAIEEGSFYEGYYEAAF